MASINKNHISLVAIGRQNPQILTVDFLRSEGIIPKDESPFKELFQGEKPFTEFISTPPFTKLAFGPIEFFVDEKRFQVRANGITDWCENAVMSIAEKYYQVLPHTPLQIVGINLNATLTFSSVEEGIGFQSLFLPEDSRILGLIENEVTASTVLQYPYANNDGRITLTFEKPNKEKTKRGINFNYEFDFTDWDSFRAKLTQFPEIASYWDGMIEKLLEML